MTDRQSDEHSSCWSDWEQDLTGRTGFLQASFTVELSLLMGLVLAMLIAILIAGFYVHDQACLQGTVCELTAMAGNLQLYKDRDSKMGTCLEKRKQTVIWSKNTAGEYSVGEDSASASCHGSFAVPGMTAGLLLGGSVDTGAGWKHNLYHPADIIRTAKGAKYLVDDILDP